MEEKLCPSCEEPVIDKIPGCPLACMSKKCNAYKREPVVNIHHKPVIWVLGGPGCGKGTQCKMIKEKYGFCHLSTGDLLRAEVAKNGEKAKCLETIMKRGGLVPNDIVLNLVYKEIKILEPTSKGFLIDGYPRERNQGTAFEKAIAPASAIIFFDTSPENLMARLMGRAATAKVQRIDDNEESFQLRIETFLAYNQPVLELYGHKIHRINADGDKEKIFAEVMKVMEPIVEKASVALAAKAAAQPAPKAGLKPAPKAGLKPAPVSTPATAPSSATSKKSKEN